MRAMVLAAGLGERLLPLTRVLPKPALPVIGRPLIAQILVRLAREGVRAAVMNLHHLPGYLMEIVGDGSTLGLEEVHYTHEPEILGTAGGLRKAADHFRREKVILVHNADFLSDIPVGAVLEAHAASGAAATLVLAPHRPGFTEVRVDAERRVVSFGKRPGARRARPAGSFLFTGFHLLSPEILDLIPEGRPSDLVRDLYEPLAAEGRLAAWIHQGFWWEFGTARSFLEGCLRLLDLHTDERLQIADTDPVREVGGARVAVGAGADFHAGGIEFRGRVALGFASMVGEACSLEDVLVMNEAWIGPGARLRRVVVGPQTEIPAGTELEEALVSPDADPAAEPPPGSERRDGFLVRRLGA